jgi:cyclopropane fatty-acyl-phospholipid synthase-like methyltransferase
MEKYYEKYEQRYKAVYAAGADQWGYTPDDATLNAVLRNWVSAHDLQGKAVLELCCGEGGAGVILSKLGCGYHGIDLAPSALETAKRLLSPFPAASVERLDLATEAIQGEYDAALDVMGFHMLLADQDRAAYLRNVYQALSPGAPMLFFNEAYSANGYEGTVDSYEQWLEITGEDFVGAVKKYAKKGSEKVEVMIPRMPGRYMRESGYRAELEAVGFIVDEFRIENDWRASIFVHKGVMAL